MTAFAAEVRRQSFLTLPREGLAPARMRQARSLLAAVSCGLVTLLLEALRAACEVGNVSSSLLYRFARLECSVSVRLLVRGSSFGSRFVSLSFRFRFGFRCRCFLSLCFAGFVSSFSVSLSWLVGAALKRRRASMTGPAVCGRHDRSGFVRV